MEKITLLSNQLELNSAFKKCCTPETKLYSLVAWIGNPNLGTPFQYLESLKECNIIFGVSFNQTHPDGVKYLDSINSKLRVVESNVTFHHKVYLFKHKVGYSLILGSSNFTYSGFNVNYESNVLIESIELIPVFKGILELYNSFLTPELSKAVNSKWIKNYEKLFIENSRIVKGNNVNHPIQEDIINIENLGWLANANWDTYLSLLKKGISKHKKYSKQSFQDLIDVLSKYKSSLNYPVSYDFLEDIDNRRKLSGTGEYSWLGHVGASGAYLKLLANGKKSEKKLIIDVINRILQYPDKINFDSVKLDLTILQKLGPSMKVWGRLLAITRPELFCTISNKSVQTSIRNTLNLPTSTLITPLGYLKLLRVINQSPWYNSPKPSDDFEKKVWENRVALLDLIFMNQLSA
jgi:hypothetical protein